MTRILKRAVALLSIMFLAFALERGQAEEYDPSTKVYCDALFMRVHAEDCPSLLMKDKKKTMTLEQADKEGWRIGYTGQSGRHNCCFVGYRRKHPKKELDNETMIVGTMERKRWKHVPGCHRTWPNPDSLLKPMKEWLADKYGICPHCKARGPNVARVDEAKLKRMDSSVGIYELPFTDPKASAEHFTYMRFFFPNGQWLGLYQRYRASGNKSHLDKLLVSARHYNKLSTEAPSVVQAKARTTEGAAFMLSMAMWARITLQKAKKSPGSVSSEEIAEAGRILKTMLSNLEPNWIGSKDSPRDQEMGVPKALADDFRSRQGNRSMNGIGTVAMMTAALKDLQAVKKTKAYQPKIDHYSNVLRNYIKYFKSTGYICPKMNGFFYPYKPESNMVGKTGCKRFRRPEDCSHYRYTVTGLAFFYESMPELGVDHDFMTAVANAVHIGLKQRQGAFTCPCVPRRNVKKYRGESEEFIVMNAFKDGTSKGRGGNLTHLTQFAQYVKALHKDRSVIHLGEKSTIAHR